jgi:hypothetical protein
MRSRLWLSGVCILLLTLTPLHEPLTGYLSARLNVAAGKTYLAAAQSGSSISVPDGFEVVEIASGLSPVVVGSGNANNLQDLEPGRGAFGEQLYFIDSDAVYRVPARGLTSLNFSPYGQTLYATGDVEGSISGVRSEESTVSNLAFQADIYGNSYPETIEYLADLRFYSFGGFGVNAHVFRSRLRSGDEIAYAISASDPYAFTLRATIDDADPVTLTVSNSDYSAGLVTMLSSSELRFTWEIVQSDLHVRLHRRAVLVSNPTVTAGHVVSESFAVENLGQPFVLNGFSEYLHLCVARCLTCFHRNSIGL